jgi:lipopolysaccharide biosynthesis regulator YciM
LHKLWDEESQCGDMQKEKKTDHVGNQKSHITKSKTTKKSSYACHICGFNGHKMTYYPKFVEMQKMFHRKFVAVGEVQHVET